MPKDDWIKKLKEEDDEFNDDYEPPYCQHPDHNFPSMIVIPPGKKHVHKCPGCNQKTVVFGNKNTLF